MHYNYNMLRVTASETITWTTNRAVLYSEPQPFPGMKDSVLKWTRSSSRIMSLTLTRVREYYVRPSTSRFLHARVYGDRLEGLLRQIKCVYRGATIVRKTTGIFWFPLGHSSQQTHNVLSASEVFDSLERVERLS